MCLVQIFGSDVFYFVPVFVGSVWGLQKSLMCHLLIMVLILTLFRFVMVFGVYMLGDCFGQDSFDAGSDLRRLLILI